MKNARVLVPVICVLIGLGVGFFGGIEYKNYQANSARANFTAGGANGNFQRFNANGTRMPGQTGRGGATIGSILSLDPKSITIKLSDGRSKIIVLSGSTTYSNTVSASQLDLKAGANVAISGTPNSDGSVTAINVQINPAFGRPQVSPSPTP